MSVTTYTCLAHGWVGCLVPCPMCAMLADDEPPRRKAICTGSCQGDESGRCSCGTEKP